MKTIEIEDDVYECLLHSTVHIGESASQILRRLLKLPKSENIGNLSSQDWKRGRAKHDSIMLNNSLKTEVSECLSSPNFIANSTALGKFLHILSYVYKRNPEEFKKVLAIKGRARKYFGESREEIDRSGNRVMPQKIPNSPYWVATNNDTPKKRRMLADVFRVLGYDNSAINQALKTLN